MSDLSKDEKKKEKEEDIKLEMFEPQKSQQPKVAKREEKESLHSQMAQKVGPKANLYPFSHGTQFIVWPR